MPVTLQEFLNENSHRKYPIQDALPAADVSSSFVIPTSLIVDMRLCVPSGSLAAGVFYISSLVIRRYTIDIGLSYKPTVALAFALGSFLNIDTTAGTNVSYTFVPLSQDLIVNQLFSDMSGSVTIGTCGDALTHAGAWEFDEFSTALNPTVIDEGLTQVRSIQVGSQKFYGNVILKEGINVILTPVYEPSTDTTTITISARLDGTSTGTNLTTDDDIITALVDLYGRPIQTINEIEPDAAGNFSLLGADCISVTTGPSSVNLNNPCGIPCCDGTYLEGAYTALNQLNVRYAKIIDFYTAASANITSIQNKLSLLEAQTGYF